MAKEETNKWTRDRTFLEEHGGDILVGVVSLLFLFLLVAGVSYLLLKPRIPGLSELFTAPPPPPNAMNQKLNLAPGEQEIILFKPRPKASPAGQKPPPSPQNR